MAFGGNDGRGALSEINVTPLVDVMLVLLVVFMVTTPMIVKSQGEVDIDLPKTNAEPVAADQLQTFIGINKDKSIILDVGDGPSPLLEACAEYPACLEGFEAKVKAIPTLERFREGDRLFVMADRTLPYGYVLDVMAQLKNAGVTNLGMVTNPPDAPGAPGGGTP